MSVRIGTIEIYESNGRQYIVAKSLGGTESVIELVPVHVALSGSPNETYETIVAHSEGKM